MSKLTTMLTKITSSISIEPFAIRRSGFVPSLLLLLAILLSALNAQATTYYVSTTGNNNNSGLSGSPVRNLYRACEKAGSVGDVVRLLPNANNQPARFDETQQALLKKGVTLEGTLAADGRILTTVTWRKIVALDDGPNGTDTRDNVYPESFLVRVAAGSTGGRVRNLILSGAPLDGSATTKTNRGHGGIIADQVSTFVISNVIAKSFRMTALFLSNATDSDIYDCVVEDSGNPNNPHCTGGISIGDATRCDIYNNRITETLGAFGIKCWRVIWDTQFPRQPNRLNFCRFYGNTITVKQGGGYGGPNFVLETAKTILKECEIYNNRFDNAVSLACAESTEPKTVRVHHNNFTLDRGYSYAVELGADNIEIDNNYIANGTYPLSNFGGKRKNLYVHNNVFDDIQSIKVIGGSSGFVNFRFQYNTVYLKTDLVFLEFGGPESTPASDKISENIRIDHNIFYKEGTRNGKFFIETNKGATIKSGTLFVSDNNFYNWAASGSASFTSDPSFKRTGARDGSTYFALNTTSEAYRREVGYTFGP